MSTTLTEEVIFSSKRPGRTSDPPVLQPGADDTVSSQELSPSYFPCLDSRPGVRGAWQSVEVSFRDLSRLRSFGNEHGVSSLSVFKAAWALVLRCYLGESNVCFACISSSSASSGDMKIESKPSIGICRVEVGEAQSILDVLKKTLMEKALFSFPERSNGSKSPPINTSLVLQELHQQDWSGLGGLATHFHDSRSSDNVHICNASPTLTLHIGFY